MERSRLSRRTARRNVMAAVLLASVGLASTSAEAETLGDAFGSHKELSTWFEMSIQGNYFQQMAGSGSYTVFAPVNSAFDKQPAGLVLQAIKGTGSSQQPDIVRLQSVIRDQVISGSISPEQLPSQKELTAMSGESIVVEGRESNLTLTMKTPQGRGENLAGTSIARVVGQPIICENGVIYPVDTLFAR